MAEGRIDVRDVKARANLVEVVRRAGVALERGTGAELVGICPFHKEKTPSFTVTPSKQLFCCFGCGKGGDVVTFVQIAEGIGFKEALQRLADEWGVIPSTGDRPPRLVEPDEGISRPPGVPELWEQCLPARKDAEVTRWLESRGIPPEAVEEMDLARAAPRERVPAWMPAAWVDRGFRVVLPVFNHRGAIATVRMRSIVGDAWPKARAAVGFTQGSAIMADKLVAYLLAGHDLARKAAVANGIYVAEGEPDFLTLATRHPERGWEIRRRGDGHPGVIGLFKSAWCPAIARSIPRDIRITVWPHRDEAGNRYAAEVHDSLRSCGFAEEHLRAAVLEEAEDVNDLLQRGGTGGWYLAPMPRLDPRTGSVAA